MNILLTSIGRRSYLVEYFQKSIGGDGKVYVGNSSLLSPALSIADGYVETPLIYDDNYIPFLLEFCKKKEINIIISVFDIDLWVLSNNINKFKRIGVNVIVSNSEVINICNDKWETYQFLINNGFNTPQTFLSIDDAVNSVLKKHIKFPLIVKPRWGMGSIGVFEAENEEELKIFYNKTRRSILNSYLKYESKSNLNDCVLIQEKLTGQEFGLDIINNLDCEYQSTVVKLKHTMRSGETDCAVTVNNKEIVELGKQLSIKLKHIANLDVDIFLSENKIFVLEMNARFGGGYPFSHLAGVNLPSAIINWCQNKTVNINSLVPKYNVFGHKNINIVELYDNAWSYN